MPALAEMSATACWEHLAAAYTVTLCFAHDGDLHAMPMNTHVHDGAVWVRAASTVACRAAEDRQRMAVTVGEHDLIDHTGWSVTARGPAAVVPDGPPSEGDPPLRPWRAEAREGGTWIRIDIDTITGRRLGAAGPNRRSPS